MFRLNRKMKAEPDKEQVGRGGAHLINAHTIAKVGEDLIALCRALGPQAIETLKADSSAKGETFEMTAAELVSTDVVRILMAFVEVNGCATEGLGQILARVGPDIGDTTLADVTSSQAGMSVLDQLAEQFRHQLAAPETITALSRFDQLHGTQHAKRAAKVFLQLVSVASSQTKQACLRASKMVADKYTEVLIPYAEGSVANKTILPFKSGPTSAQRRSTPSGGTRPAATAEGATARAKAQPAAIIELQVLWQDVVATYRNRLGELQKARTSSAPTTQLLTMLVNESENRALALCAAADRMGPEYQSATAGARATIERNRAMRAAGARAARQARK